MRQRSRTLLPPAIALVLAIAVAAVYAQTAGHGFLGYDDTTYVVDNPMVRVGLSWEGLAWAFRTGHAANWHPLTWLSHMADVSVFGLDPAGHHLVNVLFHGANAVAMFLVLRALTGAAWRSGFVALLFALHPLHVESVAWIAERKDVLSTLWALLATGAYLAYVRRPTRRRFALALLALLLGLLAKPMLVTLPLVFLLLDWWPLGRLAAPRPAGAPGGLDLRAAWPLLREKLPLLGLAAVSSVVTYRVQQAGLMVKDSVAYPLDVRFATAPAAYLSYLAKTFYPANLAMPYPHPGVAPPLALAAGAALLLAAVTGAAFAAARARPYLVVGWLWFLGMLFPVIGLVQIADQLMADRYTYLSLTGIFVALTWAVADLVRGRRGLSALVVAALLPLTVGLAVLSHAQTRHWADSTALMRHALRVTRDNFLVNNNLGFTLAREGRHQEAEEYLRTALRIRPRYAKAHFNLANVLASQGRDREAEEHFLAALDAGLLLPELHYNLGLVLGRQHRDREAVDHYRTAVRMKPDYADARSNLGSALFRLGSVEAAAGEFREAVRIAPGHALAYYNLGLAELRLKRPAAAAEAFALALRARPDYAEARLMLDGLRARGVR